MNANMCFLCLLALSLPACASLQLGQPTVVSREVVGSTTSTVELPKKRVTAEIEGTDLVVSVQKQCGTQRTDEVRTTERREYDNGSPGTDWFLGLSGVAALGVGGGLVIDSANVYSDDPTSRTYNSTGPDTARTVGYVALGAGALLLGVAVVDVIRAQGGESVSREERKERGGPTGVEPCGPVAGVEVMVGKPYDLVGKPYDRNLGTTDESGSLRVSAQDLYRDLAGVNRSVENFETMIVFASGESVPFPLMALIAAADEQTWAAADTAACENPGNATACRGVKAYLDAFPRGEHGQEARSLYAYARARLDFLRDWETLAGDLQVCDQEPTLTACEHVEMFVTKHSAGPEASEARAVLKKAAPKLAALRKKQEAAERELRKEQEAAERAAKREKSRRAGVTRANYDRLREGMSYDEVVEILGSQGEELSSSSFRGTTLVMYMWSRSDGLRNMNASFRDGRLVSKAQIGLK